MTEEEPTQTDQKEYPKVGTRINADSSVFTSLNSDKPVIRITRHLETGKWQALGALQRRGFIVFLDEQIPVHSPSVIELTRVTNRCGFAKIIPPIDLG